MVSNDEVWTRYHNHCLNEGLSENRMKKIVQMYNTIKRGFGSKELEKLSRHDIEEFINKLNRNEFKKRDNTVFLGNSKADIKKFIKQFWKWLKGNNEVYPPEVVWLRTKISKNEKPIEKEIIPKKDTIKLANSFEKIEYKIMTLILFDSGFRISELLSVTKRDLTWEDYDGIKKCFWIKCNKSKTFTRKIPIPIFTEELEAFYNSTYYATLNENDLLFGNKYNLIHKVLNERAEKVLKRKISPHLFRHSSATYYAPLLSQTQMATRYGWSYTSDELQTYIRLSGTNEKIAAKKIYENETGKLKERIAELEEQMAEIREMLVTSKLKKIRSLKDE